MTAPVISALAAHTIDHRGVTALDYNADGLFHTASTIKLLTCLVARDWVDVDLDTATLLQSYTFLQVGDVLTYSDLFHAALMPSNNAAAYTIGVDVGRRILGNPGASESTAMARFLVAMRDRADSLGWVGYNIVDTVGAATAGRFSTRMLTGLMRHVHQTDPWLFAAAGKLAHTVTVTGGRTTTANITHSVQQSLLPEFRAGKTGTWAGVPHLVIAWDHPSGNTYYSALSTSTDDAARYTDMRAILDHAIANPSPPSRRRGGAVGFL